MTREAAMITDERLAELAGHFVGEERRMRVLGHHKDDVDILLKNADTAAALRELQEFRAGSQIGLTVQSAEVPK